MKYSDINRYKINNLQLSPSVQVNSKNINIEKVTNQMLYRSIINNVSQKLTAYIYWEQIIDGFSHNVEHTLGFTFNKLQDDRLKMFRWKLLHKILPN